MDDKIAFIEMMKARTKAAAIEVIYLTRKFEAKKELQVISYQIIKSATSVGANYRAASRAISDRALYSKMKIVKEETDETIFWLEILEEVYPTLKSEYEKIKKEYNEFIRIISRTNYSLRKKFKNE